MRFLLLEDGVPTEINTKFFSRVLAKLADDKYTSSDVAYFVHKNFDKLPENARNELVMKLARNFNDKQYVANSIIAPNFDKLPSNLLFRLADNKEDPISLVSGFLSLAVCVLTFDFDKLPSEYVKPLPEHVRNELLMKLADNKYAAIVIADRVNRDFDKLPENARNELLMKLADNKETAGYVASAVAANFNKLQEKVQNLLFKLADNKDTANIVADAVASNLDKLPENVRKELKKGLEEHGYNIG